MSPHPSPASRFSGLPTQGGIEVFTINKAFLDDKFEKKVNLGIGAYRTEEGKPWVLPCVKTVEMDLAADPSLNHEYLPILGLESFCKHAASLALGEDCPAIIAGKVFGIQTLSGTGALRVTAEFLAKDLGMNSFYYSIPTWGNHSLIFKKAGFTVEKSYRYWDAEKRTIDIEGLLSDLKNALPNSVIILHACAHNPTGCDPTQEQWKQIAQVIKDRDLFPLFDMAYQGFASGDADRDAWAVRYFVSLGMETIICQSFAKNFGLYNERAGCATFVVSDPELTGVIKSNLAICVRGMYSNPPDHGARVVATILGNPHYCDEWKSCIKQMASRIRDMRETFRAKLEALETPGNWEHITDQIGMFSYTGLNVAQVKMLITKYHIYLLKSGRINMCGLNHNNMDYVVKAVNEVVLESTESKL